MSILFFDTETTGIPINHEAPISNIDNWPRIVQLAWIVCDKNRNIKSKNNYIVRPEGFVIPTSASKIHGIDGAYAEKVGKPIHHIMKEFYTDLKSSNLIVGHNIDFDIKIVGSEMYRLGIENICNTKPNICTMKSSIEYCSFETNHGSRYPKLQELYTKLFSRPFENAHDAFSDIKATFDCFWKLVDLGAINKELYPNVLMSEGDKKNAIEKYCKIGWEYAVGIKKDSHNSLKQSLEYYLKAAELGSAFAQFKIGLMYNKSILGLGLLEDNPEKAKYWFNKAANNGYVDANTYLGKIYEKEKKYDLAKKHYQQWEDKMLKDIKFGDIKALIEIAVSYKCGINGKEKDISKAKTLFLKAADKGDIRAIGEYCSILRDEGDYKQYFNYCKKRLEKAIESNAKNVLINCHEDVGLAYYNGIGTEKNYEQAKWHFDEIIKLEHKNWHPNQILNWKVHYHLGEIYEKGLLGGEIDYQRAFKYYKNVNEYSNSNVLLKLGCFYYYGLGTKKDYSKAFKYLQEADEKGISTGTLKTKAFFKANKNKIVILTIIIVIVLLYNLL